MSNDAPCTCAYAPAIFKKQVRPRAACAACLPGDRPQTGAQALQSGVATPSLDNDPELHPCVLLCAILASIAERFISREAPESSAKWIKTRQFCVRGGSVEQSLTIPSPHPLRESCSRHSLRIATLLRLPSRPSNPLLLKKDRPGSYYNHQGLQ